MSWASLASNQCVSQANLQDAIATSVFTLKNAFGSTNQEITTAEAENWVYINPIGKPANRLVVKSDLVSAPPSYYIPLYFSATAVGSCTSTTLVYGYYDGSPLGVGSYLYTDATLTVGLPNGYYWYDDNTTFQIDDVVSAGQIIAITDPCLTVTIYGKKSGSGGGSIYAWYSLDDSTYIQLPTVMTTTCLVLGTITGLTPGQTIYLLSQTADESITYGSNAVVGASCPGTIPTCGGHPFVVNPGSADQFAMTANVTTTC